MKYLQFLSIALLFIACKSTNPKESLIAELTENIKRSNKYYEANIYELKEEIINKKENIRTAAKANEIFPSFEKTNFFLGPIVDSLNTRFEKSNINWQYIKNNLDSFSSQIELDDQQKIYFNKQVSMLYAKADSINKSNSKSGVSQIYKYKLQNDVLALQYEYLEYLISKIDSFTGRHYQYFKVLTNINKSHFLKGEQLVIETTLISNYMLPDFKAFLDGNLFQTQENNLHSTKYKINKSPGKYQSEISIQFIDPNTGTKRYVTKQIDYTVYELPK